MIIVAVSGGVDSVVLLHKITKNFKPEDIVIAHVNHGVRVESRSDAEFVKDLSAKYSVKFELKELSFGKDFSEEKGRLARYSFFEEIRQKYSADYIATAHHKDDVIETAIINLIRGTGRRGLSSLQSSDTIKRPLVGFSKAEIIDYAKQNKLQWREDKTNNDTKFLRNRVRNILIPQAQEGDSDFKNKLFSNIEEVRFLNLEIDKLLRQILERRFVDNKFDKTFLKGCDEQVLVEMILQVARDSFGEYYISSERLHSAAEFIKNKNTGKQFELNGRLSIFIEKTVIRLGSAV